MKATNTFQYTTTSGGTDDCACTNGVAWTIGDGSNCQFSSTCNLGTGRLRIMNGALRIASAGVLNSAGCYVNSGSSFFIVNGGRLICR